MVARSAQHFRIAPEEESDRTAVLTERAQKTALFCTPAPGARTAVRSRRRCPADTFGATFLVTKGGKNCSSQETPNRRCGILPEVRIDFFCRAFFLLCFWLDPKAPKDQAPRKVAGDDTGAR